MTTFLLIRHGANDLIGWKLAGRIPGVHLNDEGRAQAAQLAERLANAPIAAIISSPLERARETAAPLAKRLALDVQIAAGLTDIDFGEWTNRTLEDLRASEPQWQQFNSFRASARAAKSGEWMLDVQARIVQKMVALAAEFPSQTVALFSHGDVIRFALAHFLGLHLDLCLRFEISPASVSILTLHESWPRILCMNETGASSHHFA